MPDEVVVTAYGYEFSSPVPCRCFQDKLCLRYPDLDILMPVKSLDAKNTLYGVGIQQGQWCIHLYDPDIWMLWATFLLSLARVCNALCRLG